ncbi:MAG: c-type cytochrome domain-containing protein [Acidiferrobacterales bacterium]
MMDRPMSFSRILIATVFALGLAVIAGCGPQPQLSYQADIRPILKKNCYECHLPGGQGYEKSGFSLGSYEHLMKGTKFGEVIIPGSSISSSLYLMIAGKTDPSIRMPYHGMPLSEQEIETIKIWIDQGAKNN